MCDHYSREETLYIPGHISSHDEYIRKIMEFTFENEVDVKIIKDQHIIKKVSLPSGIRKIIIDDSYLHTIGEEAFKGCSSLESIEIPHVIMIKDRAFTGCSSLKSIKLSDEEIWVGSCIFERCKNLQGPIYQKDETVLFAWPKARGDIRIKDSVRKIKDYAFSGCSELTSIEVPGHEIWLGYNIFQGCKKLHGPIYQRSKTILFAWPNASGVIEIEKGVEEIGAHAFALCSELTQIKLPDSVTKIGEYAFYECGSLQHINILDSVSVIADYAFFRCFSLKSINDQNNISDTVQIGQSAFEDCYKLGPIYQHKPSGIVLRSWPNASGKISIKEGVQVIDDRAFYNCTNLTHINIPQSVKWIGEKAFYGCTCLDNIKIPDSVRGIGEWAFAECRGLKKIKLSHSITIIQQFLFYKCSSIEEIEIPDSIKEIGAWAFEDCTSLKNVKIHNSLAKGETNIFAGCENLGPVYQKSGTILFAWPNASGDEIIKDCVKEIGEKAFESCNRLNSITIPDTVTKIGEEAFYNCENMHTVNGMNGVTEIGNGAFNKCSSLESITIPDYITKIGKGCFYLCANLKIIQGMNQVHSIGELAFGGCYNLRNFPQFNDEVILEQKVFPKSSQSDHIEGKASLYIDEDIDNGAFEGNEKLETVTIGKNVKIIGACAFRNCKELKNVIVENEAQLTEIRSCAFYGCSALTSINIPKKVTYIGSYAFWNCSSLIEFSGMRKIRCIGAYAFRDCNNLRSLPNLNKNVSIITNAFPVNLRKYNIKNGTLNIDEDIGEYAFDGSQEIKIINIGKNVKIIKESAFRGCINLKEVIIDESTQLAEIHKSAFQNCTKLSSFGMEDDVREAAIDIPQSVSEIGHYAFDNCPQINRIKIFSSLSFKDDSFPICPSLDVQVGNIIDGRYKVECKLGQGGFGNVFRVKDQTINRPRVLKTFSADYFDPEAKNKYYLKREFEALRAVDNQNIVQIFDCKEYGNDLLYIIEEYIDGTLQKKLDNEMGCFSEQESCQIIRQVANALLALANLTPPIIHRDIKPSNIMQAEDGRIKLIDFGCARFYNPAISATEIGSKYFTAPEVDKGEKDIDCRADIYALGKTWNCLLVGNTKFEKLREENISPKLINIIDKMTKEDRKDRYSNVHELIDELNKLDEEMKDPEPQGKDKAPEDSQKAEAVKKDPEDSQKAEAVKKDPEDSQKAEAVKKDPEDSRKAEAVKKPLQERTLSHEGRIYKMPMQGKKTPQERTLSHEGRIYKMPMQGKKTPQERAEWLKQADKGITVLAHLEMLRLVTSAGFDLLFGKSKKN